MYTHTHRHTRTHNNPRRRYYFYPSGLMWKLKYREVKSLAQLECWNQDSNHKIWLQNSYSYTGMDFLISGKSKEHMKTYKGLPKIRVWLIKGLCSKLLDTLLSQ